MDHCFSGRTAKGTRSSALRPRDFGHRFPRRSRCHSAMVMGWTAALSRSTLRTRPLKSLPQEGRAARDPDRSVNACTWRGLMGVKCRWPSVAIPVSPVTPGNGRHAWHRRCQAEDQGTFPRVRPCGRCRRPSSPAWTRHRRTTVRRSPQPTVRPRLEKAPDPAQGRRGHQQRAFRLLGDTVAGFRWSGRTGPATAPATRLLGCGIHQAQRRVVNRAG